jgi:hypothetical protein
MKNQMMTEGVTHAIHIVSCLGKLAILNMVGHFASFINVTFLISSTASPLVSVAAKIGVRWSLGKDSNDRITRENSN